MSRTIVHVDMDMFFAAVEIRDNPELAGKPLIVGALPNERGVVSTCSYEARKFGVRSAMSIKEAYRLCPNGVYMHPNFHKYKEASDLIHEIWRTYTDMLDFISLDEGFLDVTHTAQLFGGAREIASGIKIRVKKDTGLTCSVGIGYSMMSAKLASEEKKPDGLFEIPTPEALKSLILDRDVRIIYTVGAKTADKLYASGINTVRDLLRNEHQAISLLGNHGKYIIDLANGIDDRTITPYGEYDAQSLGKERTFQEDITDIDYLKDVLRLLIKELSLTLRLDGSYCRTVTLKVKYWNMKSITRSRSGDTTNDAGDIYNTAASLLDTVEKRPIRLVGISLGNLTKTASQHQLTLEDINNGVTMADKRKEALNNTLLELQRQFGGSIIKTGGELAAEKRLRQNEIV